MPGDQDRGDQDQLEGLIERTALGERAAFDRLYRLSSAKLLGVCLRILRDRADAEEALQESFVKIWRHAGQYSRARAKPMAWLAAIARNQSIDRLRRRKPPAADIDAASEIADGGPSPEAGALAGDERRRLLACLEELPEEQARAVRLAYFGGFTYEALAERLSVPLGTMKSRIRRSLIKLKSCLER